MKITRRSFLKGLVALAVSSGLNIPAFSQGREPYVLVGDVVDYIGPCPGGFIGGQVVRSVGDFDGIGFPVELLTNTFPPTVELFYDVDLSNIDRDAPGRFWHNPEHNIYPNIHTYVRMKRYGETIQEAIAKMNMASSKEWLAAL